jgi:cell shape-determining protein MreD
VLQGIIADLYLFQPVGYSVIIFVTIGYAVSFLSRRYFVEHRWWGNVSLVGFIVFAYVLHVFMSQILLERFLWDSTLLIDMSILSELLFVLLVNGLCFWLVYTVLKSIERNLSFYERKIQPKNYA